MHLGRTLNFFMFWFSAVQRRKIRTLIKWLCELNTGHNPGPDKVRILNNYRLSLVLNMDMESGKVHTLIVCLFELFSDPWVSFDLSNEYENGHRYILKLVFNLHWIRLQWNLCFQMRKVTKSHSFSHEGGEREKLGKKNMPQTMFAA